MEILLWNRQRKTKVDLVEIRLVAEEILRALNLFQAELSITLANDKQIRKLNRQYRKLDRPTDVLAFPMQADSAKGACPEPVGGLNPFLLGDVVISLETTVREATSLGHSFQRELNHLLIHGILHLLGYDHSQTMSGKEQELLSLIAEEED